MTYGHPLPRGWAKAALSDVCGIVSGSTPKSGVPEYWGGDLAWITPDDLSRHASQTIHSGRRSITQAGYDSCSARLVPPGSIIFSSRAPIGYTAIAGRELAVNQGCKVAVPSSAIVSKFLFWFLRWATPEIRSRASGTTFLEISGRKLGETQITLPPLNEQHRIVEALEDQLSHLDAAADNIAMATSKGLALERALLADAWNRGLNLGRMVRIDEVADTTLGKMLDSRKNSGTPTPYLANINVRWDKFDLNNLRTVPLQEREIQKFSVLPGDLLICEGGEPGRSAVWTDQNRIVAFQKALHRARCSARIRPEWLALCLKAAVRLGKTDRLLTGTTIKHLPQEKLRGLNIPLPPLDVQDALLEEFSQAREAGQRQIESISRVTARSSSLRSAVLEQAFTGTLVNQDPNDEPSTVLLERIARERAVQKPAGRRRSSRVADPVLV